MRIMVMEKILKTFGLEQTSKNIQNVYKVGDMILEDASDGFIYETAIKRGLVSVSKCSICGSCLDRYYTLTGVLDSEGCPRLDMFGNHNKDIFKIKF